MSSSDEWTYQNTGLQIGAEPGLVLITFFNSASMENDHVYGVTSQTKVKLTTFQTKFLIDQLIQAVQECGHDLTEVMKADLWSRDKLEQLEARRKPKTAAQVLDELDDELQREQDEEERRQIELDEEDPEFPGECD
jgi:hypothetical protein